MHKIISDWIKKGIVPDEEYKIIWLPLYELSDEEEREIIAKEKARSNA